MTRGRCDCLAGLPRGTPPPRLVVWVVGAALAASAACNSALFQTANVRQGASGTLGLTKVSENGNSEISEYSAFAKAEGGRAATASRIGYAVGVTVIAPLRNSDRGSQNSGTDAIDFGTYPNEWAGVFPEVKLQAPRRWPIDVAADIRLMAFAPERASLVVSTDLSRTLTPYASLAYEVALEGGIATVGSEINLTRDVSVFVECSKWLVDHNYPDDPRHIGPRRPYSVGLALSYHPRHGPDRRAAH